MASKYHVVVLDVGPSMSRHPQRKRDAVDAVTELLVNMMQYSKRDHVLVILVGTPDTENSLYQPEDDPVAYAHIVAAVQNRLESKWGFDKPTVDLARGVRALALPVATGDAASASASSSSSGGRSGRGVHDDDAAAAAPAGGDDGTGADESPEGDLLDGVMLATWHLAQLGKKGGTRLLVITDAESRIREVEAGDEEALNGLLEGIESQLVNMGTQVDVMVVEGSADDGGAEGAEGSTGDAAAAGSSGDSAVSSSSIAGSTLTLRKSGSSLLHDDDADAEGGATSASGQLSLAAAASAAADGDASAAAARSTRRASNLSVLQHLAQHTGGEGGPGVLYRLRDALESLGHLRTRTASSVTKYRGNLSIAGSAHIPVFTYSATAEARLPTAGKMPLRVFEQEAVREAQAEAARAAAAAGGNAGAVSAADEEAVLPEDEGEGGGEYDEEGAGGAGAAKPRGRAPAAPKYVVSEALMKRRFKRATLGAGAGAGTAGGRGMRLDAGGGDEAGGEGAGGDEWEEEEVNKGDTGRAFRYGRDMVTLADESVLKWTHPKALEALGFIPAAAMPRELIVGSTDLVLPWPGNEGAARALSALARALAAEGSVLLVRYIKRGGEQTSPMLAVCIPALRGDVPAPPPADDEEGEGEDGAAGSSSSSSSSSSAASFAQTAAAAERRRRRAALVATAPADVGRDCLYLLPVPWNDDIRHYAFAPLGRECRHPPVDAIAAARAAAAAGAGAGGAAAGAAGAAAGGDKLAPSLSQLEAADALIDAMNISTAPAARGVPLLDPYQPLRMHNPVIARFNATMRARALADPGVSQNQVPLAPLDPRIAAYLEPPPALLLAAQKEAAAFRAAFGPELRRQRNPQAASLLGARELYAELPEGERGDWIAGVPGAGRAGATGAAGRAALKRAAGDGDWDGEGAASSGAGTGKRRRAGEGLPDSSAAAAGAGAGASLASGSYSAGSGHAGAASSAPGEEEEEGEAGAGAGGRPSKRRRHEEAGDAAADRAGAPAPAAAGPAPRVVQVGTATPQADFAAMLAYRGPAGDLTGRAISGMQAVIGRLAGSDALDQEKGLECLAALRAGCLSVYEEAAFNDFLRALRTTHAPGLLQRHVHAADGSKPKVSGFWRRLQRAGVSLISRGESENAAALDVTPEGARAFLTGEDIPAPPEPVAAPAEHADSPPKPAPEPEEEEEEDGGMD